MKTPRRNPLTRRSAARALAGTTTSGSALDQLLAAATAPATEAELTREGSALATFQQGGTTTAHRAAGVGLAGRLGTGRIAAAGVAAALLVVGALAIAVGVGPGDGVFTTPSEEPSAPAALAVPGDSPAELTEAREAGQQIQSFAGLCRAFQAEATTNGNVASNPDYEPLADDAGGQDEIKKYCQVLLGAPTVGPSSGTSTAAPTSAANPTDPARPTSGSTSGSAPDPAPEPTRSSVPTPSVQPTQPPVPSPTATPTQDRPGGKPTKTPRP